MTAEVISIGAYARYVSSPALVKAAYRVDRLGQKYCLGKVVGSDLWMPRNTLSVVEQNTCLDLREDGTPVEFGFNFTPRNNEQADVHIDLVAKLAALRSFLFQAPTGWGKTIVTLAAIAKTKRRTLVLVTKEDLLQRWVKDAKSVLGLSDDEVGVWQSDSVPRPEHKIVIGMVHSVCMGPDRYPEWMFHGFGLVVVDEVHRMGAETFSEAMWWLPARLRLGLSATPRRKDGREEIFQQHVGVVEVKAHMETLVPKVFVERTGFKVPTKWRDGERKQIPHEPGKCSHITTLMKADADRNTRIVKFVTSARRRDRTVVVFSDYIEHLDILRDLLIAYGTPPEDIGYYVGLTSGKYPGKNKEEQREAATLLPVMLATYTMMGEGTDIPWLDTCVLAIPRADVEQIVGRIRREYDGKKFPAVHDLVDEDSWVFNTYAKKREKWYKSIGAEIVKLN